MRKIGLLILMVIPGLPFPGCVTKMAALRYGRKMYDVGYATARTETSLQTLTLSLQNSALKEELSRRDDEAEERNRRSNPYAVELPPPVRVELEVQP